MTRRGTGTALALVLAAASSAPASASGQILASERASVAQTVDGTTVVIEYSRPRLRGRDVHADLFGNQIRWGDVWTPGANEATVLDTDQDIRIHGTAVPAGRWSVWMVVDPEAWTLVLDPRDDLYHTDHPEPSDDQIRIPIETTEVEASAEALTWSFPSVRADGADLRMQWGRLAVDLAVEVEPTVRIELTAEEAAPYLGTWAVEHIPSEYQPDHRFETEFRFEDSMLLTTFEWTPEFYADIALVMAAEQVFQMGYIMEGEVAEVGAWGFLEFLMDAEGRAVSFEYRDTDDALMTRGTRVR